ncbi:MAG: D-alanine--D-alanine ligase [Desulfovibrionaceae bacterium]
MRVLLIAGGWSTEREVSLNGARQIHAALLALGHEVDDLDLSDGLTELLRRARRADFAFLSLHGSPGEDGLVQALLARVGCPYQGSDAAGSFLAMDKAAAKAVFEDAGIPTPPWELVTAMPGPGWRTRLKFPVFVKPDMGGSSLGMSLVKRRELMPEALAKVFALGEAALVEQRCEGPELTCAVLGDRALPLILIRPREGAPYFDYSNKYDADGAEEICPAPVDESVTKAVQALARRAHAALGLAGYSRADFILTDAGPTLLEVNTLPGMTSTSLLPRAAKAAGLDFTELIAELIRLGLADARTTDGRAE